MKPSQFLFKNFRIRRTMEESSRIAIQCFKYGALYNSLPCLVEKRPLLLVWNIDGLLDEPYIHFVAGCLNKDGTGEYFDPRGEPPSDIVLQDFFKRHCPRGVIYNTQTLAWGVTTGEHCLVYVRERAHQGICGFLRKLIRKP